MCMIDRSALKAAARLRIAESQPRYWKVMLVWVLAAVLGPEIILNVIPSPMDNFTILVSGGINPYLAMNAFGGLGMVWMFLSLVIGLYQIVLDFGLDCHGLRLYRGEGGGQKDLFEGFSMAGRVIVSQLLVALLIFLWGLLLGIPLVILISVLIPLFGQSYPVIFMVALYIVYFIAVIIISLRYSLTMFALADEPGLGALGAVRRSKDLIRGRVRECLMLHLSFLGWGLVCSGPIILLVVVQIVGATLGGSVTLFGMPAILEAVVFVVAALPFYLWLEPYMRITFAGYYDTLCPRQKPQYEPLNEYPHF